MTMYWREFNKHTGIKRYLTEDFAFQVINAKKPDSPVKDLSEWVHLQSEHYEYARISSLPQGVEAKSSPTPLHREPIEMSWQELYWEVRKGPKDDTYVVACREEIKRRQIAAGMKF